MMNAKQQLTMCGWDGRPLAPIAAQIERHARIASHKGKQKVQKQIVQTLGLRCWPGRGVLEAALRGDDYVSPAVGGIVMHAVLGGDADLYHFLQIANAT